jgi:hypothetical protein
LTTALKKKNQTIIYSLLLHWTQGRTPPGTEVDASSLRLLLLLVLEKGAQELALI